MRRAGIISLAIPLLLGACVRRPEGVLSDKDMASLVCDMELVEAYLQSHPQSGSVAVVRQEMINYIIDKHGLSRAEYDSTMAWYGRNIDSYRDMQKLVEKELAARGRKMTGASVELHESADLWPLVRHAVISPLSGSNVMDFSIPTADVIGGERIEMMFRMRTPVQSSVLLGVEYDNGSYGYSYATLSNQRKVKMVLQTDTARQVRRIFGNFSVADSRDLPLWLDSIYMHKLPFDSLEYYNIHAQRVYRGPHRWPKGNAGASQDSVSNTPLRHPTQRIRHQEPHRRH